jgi:RNA polymerase sigma-32 factor
MTPRRQRPKPSGKATAARQPAPSTPELNDAAPAVEPASTSLVPSDPLHRYLAEVRRYSLLSAEEEHEMAVRWRRDRDRDAAYRLATGNLRLVVHIAMAFRRATLNLMDLIQEGNIGLLQAVERFDPFRGVRFSAYASWWIRAYILKYIMDHWSLVRVGTTNDRRKLFFNLSREKKRLEAQGIRPEPRLLAERLGVSEEDVIDVQQAVQGRDLSLEAPLRSNPESSLVDVLPAPQPAPDEQAAENEYREALRRKFQEFGQTLKGKELEIFNRRLVAEQPATLQEIGDSYGVTREAIRQIEKRVIDRLRLYLTRELAGFHGIQAAAGPSGKVPGSPGS